MRYAQILFIEKCSDFESEWKLHALFSEGVYKPLVLGCKESMISFIGRAFGKKTQELM
jgi:hypothetical protein